MLEMSTRLTRKRKSSKRKCSNSPSKKAAMACGCTPGENDLEQALINGLDILTTFVEDCLVVFEEYARELTQIAQIFSELTKHLNTEEMTTLDLLKQARDSSQKGLHVAIVLVKKIKAQAATLAAVLDPKSSGDSDEKLKAACLYFSQFAIENEKQLKEAEDAIMHADSILQGARDKLTNVTSTLKRIQDEYLSAKKAAVAKKRLRAYGLAAAGIILGKIGLLISYSAAIGITEGFTIPDIEKSFVEQREIIDGYISNFTAMDRSTKSLQRKLQLKRQHLTEVHAKLSTTGSLAGNAQAMKAIPTLHVETICKNANDLVLACETFLQQQPEED